MNILKIACLSLAVCLAAAIPNFAAAEEENAHLEPVLQVFEAISERDWEKLEDAFAEEAYFVAVNLGYGQGAEGIADAFADFMEPAYDGVKISNIVRGVEINGPLISIDRLEVIEYDDGSKFEIRNALACFVADGKIVSWMEWAYPEDLPPHSAYRKTRNAKASSEE